MTQIARFEVPDGTLTVERDNALEGFKDPAFELWHYRDGIEPELVGFAGTAEEANAKAREAVLRTLMERVRDLAVELEGVGRLIGAVGGVDYEAEVGLDVENEIIRLLGERPDPDLLESVVRRIGFEQELLERLDHPRLTVVEAAEGTFTPAPPVRHAYETDNGPGGISWEVHDVDVRPAGAVASRFVRSCASRGEAEALGATVFHTLEEWERMTVAERENEQR